MHAITSSFDANLIQNYKRDTAIALIACGLEPHKGKCILYNQSSVSGHAELTWILSCLTPIGWLQRMTQYKEKIQKHKENLGLLAYPVLMAADVLLYKATHVPVGDDQRQHLELSRDIAKVFNTTFNTEYFPYPVPIYGISQRVMSLRDGITKNE